MEEGSRRVIAACWGPGREGSPLTTLVALDEAGNLLEVLSLPAFSGVLRNRRGYLADIPPTLPTHIRQIYKAQVSTTPVLLADPACLAGQRMCQCPIGNEGLTFKDLHVGVGELLHIRHSPFCGISGPMLGRHTTDF